MSGLRRRLQLTLGVLWLLDAALQYQPYMFSRAFATQTLAPTAQGNPAPVARSITWSAGLIDDHVVVANAVFATVQLLLALGLFWRRTVKAALVGSVVWSGPPCVFRIDLIRVVRPLAADSGNRYELPVGVR